MVGCRFFFPRTAVLCPEVLWPVVLVWPVVPVWPVWPVVPVVPVVPVRGLDASTCAASLFLEPMVVPVLLGLGLVIAESFPEVLIAFQVTSPVALITGRW